MTRHRHSGDELTDRIIANLDGFEGWRDDPKPAPKFDVWPDDPPLIVGKMLPMAAPWTRTVETVTVPELTSDVPMCPCGARVDDGRHLISEARWRGTLADG